MIRSVLPLFFLGLLAACSSVPTPAPELSLPAAPPAPLVMDDAQRVLEAIAHAQRVSAATPDEQRRDMAAAAQALARERTTVARLRYGVLLSLPALPGADVQRAMATLAPLTTAGHSARIRQFAHFLLSQLVERDREEKRARQFKDQLDELRAIERSLIERGQVKK